MQRVLTTGKQVGTPVGLHVQTVEDVERRIEEGWQFLAVGSELKMMVTEAQRIVAGLNDSAQLTAVTQPPTGFPAGQNMDPNRVGGFCLAPADQ